MRKATPYIAVISTSAFIGNLLVIGLGFGMYWQTLEPIEFMQQFGVQFPLLLAPTMGILLPAMISTVIMFVRSKQQPKQRKSWGIALIALIITCTITSAYHLPTNFGFMDMSYTEEVAQSKLSLWLLLHWLRAAFVLVAAIFSVQALHNSLETK